MEKSRARNDNGAVLICAEAEDDHRVEIDIEKISFNDLVNKVKKKQRKLLAKCATFQSKEDNLYFSR